MKLVIPALFASLMALSRRVQTKVPLEGSRSFHSDPSVFPRVPTGTPRGHARIWPVIPSTETPKNVAGIDFCGLAEMWAGVIQGTLKASRKMTASTAHLTNFNCTEMQ